jgi:hypothetical protein
MLAEQTAAVAALRAAWKPAQVHEQGKVPASPTTPYAVVGVTTSAPTTPNNNGQWGSKFFRVVIQFVGKSTTELSAPVEAADEAFLDKSLAVEGWDVAPPDPSDVVSSQPFRDMDAGGLLTCTVLYPMYAFPEES